MASLLRSSSHGNGVAVIADRGGTAFRKLGHGPAAAAYLERDYRGIQWFRRIAQIDGAEPSLIKGETSSLLVVPALPGRQVSVEADSTITQKYVIRALQYYRDIWPNGDQVPFHGDLTLDNILFSEEAVCFFDWEHFNNDGLFWGFDALYLALSSVYLPHIAKSKKLHKRSAHREIWNVLYGMGIDRSILSQPLGSLRDIFTNDTRFRAILDASPRKLFPMILSEIEIEIGDKYFARLVLDLNEVQAGRNG